MQPVEVRLADGSFFTVFNLYNSNASITAQEFIYYVDQLASPYVLSGDFNAHSPLLSSICQLPDATGRSLENLLITTDFGLLNPVDFVISVDRRSGRGGCLDLFILSSGVIPDFTLRRLRDVGSDHYRIMAASNIPLQSLSSLPVPRWKITDAGMKDLSRKMAPSTLINPAAVYDM